MQIMMSGKKKQDQYGFITGAGYVQATNYVPRLAKQRRKYEEKNFAMKTKSLTSIAFSGTTTMLRRMKCHQSLGMGTRIANVNLKHLIIRYSMYMCTSVCMDVWMCVCMRSVQRRFISLLSKKFARKVFLQMFHIVGNVFKLICNKIIHL